MFSMYHATASPDSAVQWIVRELPSSANMIESLLFVMEGGPED